MNSRRKIYFFGSGRLGKLIYMFSKNIISISGFIDNDKEKIGTYVEGVPVYSLSHILCEENKYIVITSNQHEQAISKQLMNKNLIRKLDFCYYKEWFSEIFYQKNMLLQGYVELYITDRCTLKCKACGLFVPYVQEKKDCNLHELQTTVDSYFSVVDKVLEFRVLGGEPFLYKNLSELLEYIGENYRHKIQGLKIVSNGTVIPAVPICKLLSKYSVEVDISEYPKEQAIQKRTRLLERLRQEKVHYTIMKMDYWIDMFGNPKETKRTNESDLKNIFKACGYGCRTLYKNRLYFCSIDCAAQRLNFIRGTSSDYIDLNLQNSKELRRKLLEFDFGHISKGYVSFCANCNGGIGINKTYIPVAEQGIDFSYGK